MPSKRKVLRYLPNLVQEARVSVHSERTLNLLAWWSGGCSLHNYRRDQSLGLQLWPFILGQRIWLPIPWTQAKRKRKIALHHSVLMQVPIPNDAQSVHMFQLTLTRCFSAGIEKSLQWEGNKNRVVDRKRRTWRETKESVLGKHYVLILLMLALIIS